MDKKKLFGVLGALGVALASGAGSKIAEVVMKKTTDGGNEPEPDDGHVPTPEEAEVLAKDNELIKESIEEVEEEETTEK